MLTWIREKFGKLFIGGIIGFIGFVFVFYGVFNPKSTRGLHEGAVAGTINGDPITIAEFNRELNRRVEFYKNMFGGQFNEEQMRSFRMRDGVFEELARRKLLVQEAYRQGLTASDEEVRQKVQEIPAFQKDGRFDLPTYRSVLEANNYTPGGFERLMREDLSVQRWSDYFRDRVHVSQAELKKEFLLDGEKRNVKYVLLTNETGKKGVKVTDEEVKKFLADAGKVNLARSNFDRKKESEFKGKAFEDVKARIAEDLLAGEKIEEIRKINDQLAERVLPLLKADKGSDAKVNELLKPYGAEVKTTGFFARGSEFTPGLGRAPALVADAFAKQSPIDPAQGGKARKYPVETWIAVAVVSESQHADLARFDAEREKLAKKVATQKERSLYDEWLKKLMEKAKIDKNPSVVSDQET